MGKKLRTSAKKMKISNKRRIKLIDLVLNKNYTVVKAAKILQLKLCTARNIINKYKKQGIIYDKVNKRYVDPSTLQEYQIFGIPALNSKQEESDEIKLKQMKLEMDNQDITVKQELQEKQQNQKIESLIQYKKEEVEFPMCYIYYYV